MMNCNDWLAAMKTKPANFHVKVAIAKADGGVCESWIDATDLSGSPRSNFDRDALREFVRERRGSVKSGRVGN